jgi:putative NIF3 family GTP cyclohydrolase 1 type 2
VKAKEIREHFRGVGHWVDWNNTCDQFLHGNPEVEVEGIATAWIPTNKCIKEASEKGLNLFITHEPIFYHGYRGADSREKLVQEKKKLLDESGITILRCHDTWDRMPDVGIPDAWASFLGFETEERPTESFYKICLLGDITVEEAAERVLEKVRSLGQDTVLIFGDRQKKIDRMAVGTGAITNLPRMYELKADLILATDDGMNFWDGGLWAKDLDVPLLIVNHCTAEKPGMQEMAGYLAEKFPGIPVEYLDVDFPYVSVR